jgi:hypothetical protein
MVALSQQNNKILKRKRREAKERQSMEKEVLLRDELEKEQIAHRLIREKIKNVSHQRDILHSINQRRNLRQA